MFVGEIQMGQNLGTATSYMVSMVNHRLKYLAAADVHTPSPQWNMNIRNGWGSKFRTLQKTRGYWSIFKDQPSNRLRGHVSTAINHHPKSNIFMAIEW